MRVEQMQSTSRRLVRRFGDGGLAVIRRPNTLSDPAVGDGALPLTSTKASPVTGQTVLELEQFTPNQGRPLAGRLVAGTTVNVNGHATTYTLVGDADAEGDAITVTITPGLEAGWSLGARWVQFNEESVDASWDAVATRFLERDIDGKGILGTDRLIILSGVGPDIEISRTDLCTFAGKRQEIQRVMPLEPNDRRGAVRLHVGAR